MPEESEAQDYQEALNKGLLLAGVQLIFLGVLLFVFYKNWNSTAGEATMWLYGAASAVSVIALSIVTIIFKDGHFFKNTVILLCSSLNVFLLPMAYYARTADSVSAFHFALLFQMALIAVSSLEGVLLVGASGTVFLYNSQWFLGQGVEADGKLLTGYCFVFAVALLWRLLAKRLFSAFTALQAKEGQGDLGASAVELKRLEEERDSLKVELVEHVVGMKEFMREQNVEGENSES